MTKSAFFWVSISMYLAGGVRWVCFFCVPPIQIGPRSGMVELVGIHPSFTVELRVDPEHGLLW